MTNHERIGFQPMHQPFPGCQPLPVPAVQTTTFGPPDSRSDIEKLTAEVSRLALAVERIAEILSHHCDG